MDPISAKEEEQEPDVKKTGSGDYTELIQKEPAKIFMAEMKFPVKMR